MNFLKAVGALGLIVSTLFSCSTNDLKESIKGVWVHGGRENIKFLHDDASLFHDQPPIIIDFKKDGDVFVKDYGYQDTIYSWSVTSDSTLTFGGMSFSIQWLDEEKLQMLEYDKYDTFLITFIRPKEVSIDFTGEEIEHILLSNIWAIEDSAKYKNYAHIEFFDNSTLARRYKRFDRKFEDTVEVLNPNTWGIAKYQNYYFLYHYRDYIHSNFGDDAINQLIEVTPSSYRVREQMFREGEMTYVSKGIKSKRKELVGRMQGTWVSRNSLDRRYLEEYNERRVKEGTFRFYEGDLYMDITDSLLTMRIETLPPVMRSWQIGKDGRTLVFEDYSNDPIRYGAHVDFADISELSDERLVIRWTYMSRYLTGLEKSNFYLLNLIQEFEKADN